MIAQSLSRLFANDAPVPTAAAEVGVTGITSNSRDVKPGFVFVAISGTRTDGAAFIPQALSQGASAIVVETGRYQGPGVVIEVNNPRRMLALLASRFSGKQPETIVAVTGTNGKTSVAVFVRQIWESMGFRAASLGTIGVIGPGGSQYVSHTTPDPVELHAIAARLREEQVRHLAVEASSHGLAQYRLDGLRLTAGAFTNLTLDHLDYHENFENYLAAKLRLFSELLPQGSGAVINADSDYADKFIECATARGLVIFRCGQKGQELKLLDVRREGMEQHLHLATTKQAYKISLPLVGDFQISNALVAAGLAIVAGGDESQVFHALESLKGARGRLDLVGRTPEGAGVFVDYAHTPDALENVLVTLKPFVTGKLVVVFGCGGDRDKTKRPVMGAVARQNADVVIVTDDNPRSEVPATIREEILKGAAGAIEIGDRAQAIVQAVKSLQAGDILLIAGKGHEEGQIIGTTIVPFSDHEAAHAALQGEQYHG